MIWKGNGVGLTLQNAECLQNGSMRESWSVVSVCRGGQRFCSNGGVNVQWNRLMSGQEEEGQGRYGGREVTTACQFAEQRPPPQSPRGDSKLHFMQMVLHLLSSLNVYNARMLEILGFHEGKSILNYCTLNVGHEKYGSHIPRNHLYSLCCW